jgi:hypothetical protein
MRYSSTAIRWLALQILATLMFARLCSADGRVEVRVVDSDGNLTPVRAWVDVGIARLFKPVAPDTVTTHRQVTTEECRYDRVLFRP